MNKTHPTIRQAMSPPSRPVKAAFLDVDGTLVREGEDVVPEPARRAVAATLAKGILVVPCTGRSVVGVLPIAEQLRLVRGSFFIASNGAVTGELTGNRRHPFEILHTRVFDPWAAFTVAMAVAPQVSMAVEQVGVGWRVNRPFPEGRLNGLQHVVAEKVLWSEHVTRAVVHAPGIARYAPQIEGTGCTATPNGPDWLDVTKRGLSKATEADALRLRWGIHPDDTAAIGDGHNDIPLLHQVHHAFAMGHADQRVKDAADYVVGAIDQHGVAEALNCLTLSRRESGALPVRTGAGAR
ncbi:HAD family hydrolase [Myceligenerans salitolerans]|uniref:HAD-IIB family hydrolase n=1 Tax=Myceligenerans salitolerans TaxID=1230528 RepID=A0ABS3I7B9_9MICO|nr:HAD family hydrolase [Myceligenerans salitolerans]MBO0608890.1 HAD-IIB family hydrolase [Myceligenerans salitolerans]